MELILPVFIIIIAITSYIFKPSFGLLVLVAILIFFREGWHPDMGNAVVLYKLDIMNLHVIEVIVASFFLITIINKLILGNVPFRLPKFTGILMIFFLLIIFSAIHGFVSGASLKSAFGYGEWRILVISMSMLILVPNILDRPDKVEKFINWIYVFAFIRACQGIVAYLIGKGQVHATLRTKIVYWDSAENMLFAVLISLVINEIFLSKSIAMKTWVKFLSCLPMIFSIIFSLRRNSWVQLGVSLLLVFVILNIKQKLKIVIAGFFILAGLTGLLVSGAGGDKGRTVITRIASFGSFNVDTNSFHLFDMYDAFLQIKKNPWMGVGFGKGFKREKSYYVGGADIEPNIVHNTYLHIWLKMGIFGLLTFILFWLAFIFDNFQGYKTTENKKDQILILGLMANIFAVLAVVVWGTDLIANTRVPMIFYTLFGIIPALSSYYRNNRNTNRDEAMNNEQL